MTEELEKIEIECQVNENDTIRLEDYSPDKQLLFSMRDDWGTSEIYISVEDAEKMRDWLTVFCQKYKKQEPEEVENFEDQILTIVDQLPEDLESLHQTEVLNFNHVATSEIYISTEDAERIRDWWIAFCGTNKK